MSSIVINQMRILRRLPKYASILRYTTYQNDGNLGRFIVKRSRKDDAVELQLTKYGYQEFINKKNRYTYSYALAGFVSALFIHKYIHELYQNELKTVEQARIIEVENSAIIMRIKKAMSDYIFRIESRVFNTYQASGKVPIDRTTEAILRIKQYRHFEKNRNRTMDFSKIGTAEKYPFPIVQNKKQKPMM